MTHDWDQRYRVRDTPWDSGIPSRELRKHLEEGMVTPCRAIEMGCGTGTNAVYLASQGFEVTACDLSSVALEGARRRADAAGVSVRFVQADLCRLDIDLGTFDFLFDRGCFHCARKIDLPGYLQTLQQVTHAGTKALVLTGNADETAEHGPPRLTEAELRADLGGLFQFLSLRAFRFEDPGGVDGPLGWSCFLKRLNSP